jgi:hypothetical protein
MNNAQIDSPARPAQTMRCPNCGHEQPRGEAECRSCQVIFDKFLKKQAFSGGQPAFAAGASSGALAQDAQMPEYSPSDAKSLQESAAAGVVVAVMTLIAIGLEAGGVVQLGLGGWALLDVGMILGLSYGVSLGSRLCACGLLMFYVCSKLAQWSQQPPSMASLGVPLALMSVFAKGAWASFSRRG